MKLQSLTKQEYQEVYNACLSLFTGEQISRDFLVNLNLGKVKSTFRDRAKQLHPDLQRVRNQRNHDMFINITEAYRLLVFYLQNEVLNDAKQTGGGCRIIAVGGAKGGIGKSMFASNLAVLLAKEGYRTVAIDLDLGGSNLHLYLGEATLLKSSINDYISKRAATLEDVMISSKYGPMLIGGNSSELGAANIHFARKLRLLKAIRAIDADYVILDLGGDTTYNMVDFYLAADYGVVMTTTDSASYLGAYQFLKAALYRKLNRLFGPESRFMAERDRQLELFIHDATIGKQSEQVKTIEELKSRAWKERPSYQHHINRAIEDFRPLLVINRAVDGTDVSGLVGKLKGVCGRWLSKEPEYLGALPASREVQQSARDLCPVIIKKPDSAYSKELAQIAGRLLRHF